MPSCTRPGWRLLCRPTETDREVPDEQAAGTARWLADHGAGHGVRVPHVMERARALGLECHYRRLRAAGLSTSELFTAQGNSFDHWAVEQRIGAALVAWLQGADLPRHSFPPPTREAALYARMRAAVLATPDGAGLRFADEVSPAYVMAMVGDQGRPAAAPPPPAAGAGRGPQ